MKTMLAVLVAGTLGVAGLSADEGHKHDHGDAKKAKAESITVTGEILDLACYMGHGGMGKEHAKCAKKCVLGGAPAGILNEKGEVYLLVEDHSDSKAVEQYEAVKNLAGEKVKVTGKLSKKGGLQAILVSTAKKV